MSRKNKPQGVRLTLSAKQLAHRREQIQKAQTALCLSTAEACLPYMPKVTGALIASQQVEPTSGEIRVGTAYARRVYTSGSGVGRPSGVLRGPKWFTRMKADKAGALLQQAKNALGVL